jgi:2-haloacid dehalogenase
VNEGEDHSEAAAPMTEGKMYTLLSFDVYGTLVNTPPANAKAFQAILKDAGATNIDPVAFYNFWESRNIAQYREPYRSYKAICRTSLEDAFAHFKVGGADPSLIEHFFAVCREMKLYPDVLPTLERLRKSYRIAVVSNIDDDLLQSTPVPLEFDLVCTAERAKGYKPDGTLFRYLLDHSGLPVDEILHSGQSQFTDLVGAKPLGLTVAWINRQGLKLSPDVPPPDHILPDIASLPLVLT